MAVPSPSQSLPRWLLVAVPTACVTTSFLVYTHRRTLYSWVYALVAKTPKRCQTGKPYLSGNYAPVDDELLVQDLPVVEGQLPEGLEGCYVKTGPNPFLKPIAGYHWFDGDGMLHLVRIKDGRASYCNRYVQTERLQLERQHGRPLYSRLGDLKGLRGLALVLLNDFATAAGILPERQDKGAGTANTALTFHAGRLLSLNEGDLPYGVRVLCSGLVETMGRLVFDRSWKLPFTAHPKRDPSNDELLFFGYRFDAKPYVTAGILDKYGNMTRQWGVDLPYPVMMHDMLATKNYFVLLHMPLCFDPELMIKKNTVPFILKKELPARVGLLRRDQPSCPAGGAQVTWFELPGPGCNVFHTINAWEEDNGDVKMYVCQMDELNLDIDDMKAVELARVTEYILSPSTGTVSVRRMTEVAGDFPVIHPGKTTQPCRWAWVATMDGSSSVASFHGIAKMDLQAPPGVDACVGRIAYPPGVYGGEAVFVPRVPASGTAVSARDEDDGYLVVYVHDNGKDVSYMNVYDARTMAATPLASVRMPRRVPYAFHGTWVTEEELKKQVMWV